MSTLLGTLDTELNFWEANPNFKSIKLFRQFMLKDKSKKKDYSSRVMWAIALCYDKNIENTWKNMAIEEKKALLASDIIEKEDFNWDDIAHLEFCYQDRVMSLPEKDLLLFEEKLHKRQKFMDNTEYSWDSLDEQGKKILGTAKQLDDMMANTKKLYDQLKQLQSEFIQSEEEGHVRGGRTESASEQGLI